MKAIILLLALTSIPTLTHARQRPSTATFRADGPFQLTVSIDGQLINRRPARRVESFPLRPGRHRVTITANAHRGRQAWGHRGRNYPPSRTIHQTVVIRPGVNRIFAVRTNGRNRALYVEVDNGGYPERRGRYQEEPVRYLPQPVCDDAQYFPVQRVVMEMRYRPHDRARLQIAKDAICNGSLLAGDLRHMMQRLSFDESRMELAVYAHDRVCDIHAFLSSLTRSISTVACGNSSASLGMPSRSRPQRILASAGT